MADETAVLTPLLPPLPPPEVLVAGAQASEEGVPHDPALYDGDEEGEEEDPYEVYVLRRPHERSSVVVPQLAKQPEMADTRLRYRRIPPEARSGSIGSLGNHFPPRFEFPNRPSLLEALTSDDESSTSLSIPARSLHRNPRVPARAGASALASPPVPFEPGAYESVADEIAAGGGGGAPSAANARRRRKRRAPRPPLPRGADAFAGSDAAAVVGPEVAAAIVASARPKHARRPPLSPAASPVSTPDSSARSGGSVDSEPAAAQPPRPRTPSRPQTPTYPPVARASPPPPRARTPDPEAILGRMRLQRRSSPEIKRFHSAHADTTADNAARDLRRRSSAGAPSRPAGLAEWEGRKICAPAALGGAGASFVLLAEEPVLYQNSRTRSSHAALGGRPAAAKEEEARPTPEKNRIPQHSARMAARRKRLHRSSMRFRRSLVPPPRARRARKSAAAGVSTRRSEASRRLSAAAFTRDRELSVSTRVRPSQTQGAGPANALRKVLQALRLGTRASERR